jgi:hypothetical protein
MSNRLLIDDNDRGLTTVTQAMSGTKAKLSADGESTDRSLETALHLTQDAIAPSHKAGGPHANQAFVSATRLTGQGTVKGRHPIHSAGRKRGCLGNVMQRIWREITPVPLRRVKNLKQVVLLACEQRQLTMPICSIAVRSFYQ